MTIPFTCPHCGTPTDVFDEYAGLTGPCAICGKPITVPYPSTASAGSADGSPGQFGQQSAVSPNAAGKRFGFSWIFLSAAILIAVIAGVGGISLVFALLIPAVRSAQSTALKSQSSANLKAIAAALQKYEDTYGSFPPAYIADAKGKPMHSWRVLLLPYLGYQHVYDRYNFNFAWDSPENAQLLSMMPTEYASPADPDAALQFETSYMVITGSETMFPDGKSTPRVDVTDGFADTILVVETCAAGVSWMEPKDLDASLMQFKINGREGMEIGSKQPGGAHVLTVDGESHFLPDEAPPEVIRAMTTIRGNEFIPWELLE